MAKSTREIGLATSRKTGDEQIVPSAYEAAICHLCQLAFCKIALRRAGNVLDEHLVSEFCGFQKPLREFLVTHACLHLHHFLHGPVKPRTFLGV